MEEVGSNETQAGNLKHIRSGVLGIFGADRIHSTYYSVPIIALSIEMTKITHMWLYIKELSVNLESQLSEGIYLKYSPIIPMMKEGTRCCEYQTKAN